MALTEKRLESLSEDDLQALVTAGVPEGRRIEYKRQLPGNSDDEKRELLADVSSFANASGGDLLYGVEEAGGLPTAIIGVSGVDPDAEILRLESIIRTGVDPRIPGVHLRAVPLASGSFVLVVRIPQSWALPHVVGFKNLSRFYSRTSAGKYQLDVSELRALFVGSSEAAERIRRFRDERLARIVAGEGAFEMSGQALVVLHLVPLRIFGPATRFDLRQLDNQTVSLPPLYAGGWNHRYNLDGFATWSPVNSRAGSYVQVFRHGAIEAVEASMLEPRQDRSVIQSAHLAKELVNNLPRYLAVQRELGVDLPVVILLELVGVKGYRLATGPDWFFDSAPIDRDLITCPEMIVEDWDTEASTMLRPGLDAIWNAGGYAECTLYDEKGAWQPR